MKHVTMELGGKSPMVVFDDADLESAISGAVLGNFYSTGQVCSNGTRVFVQRGIREAFVKRMVERLESGVKMGDPLDEATNFGPMSNARQLEIVEDYIRKGVAEGATLAYGGKRVGNEGFYIEPAIFTDVTDDMTIAREEIFGPVLSVLDFDTEEEALTRANATEFGLAAGVFTNDLGRAHRMVAGFEAGTCYINAYNLAPVEAPFGGSKQSGVGRENSKAAIEHYSEIKSVYVAMNPCEAPF
jgi:betaine-aldehyde dehydrogenase